MLVNPQIKLFFRLPGSTEHNHNFTFIFSLQRGNDSNTLWWTITSNFHAFFSTLSGYRQHVGHSLHSLNSTGTYVIAVGPSACSYSRDTTECLGCQGRLWSLLALTLKVNQLSGSSPCVGNLTWSWGAHCPSQRCCRETIETASVFASFDTSTRVVEL
jgi:hypothetical protein